MPPFICDELEQVLHQSLFAHENAFRIKKQYDYPVGYDGSFFAQSTAAVFFAWVVHSKTAVAYYLF